MYFVAFTDRVLYVRKTGCNYGYCTAPATNYTDICLLNEWTDYGRAGDWCCSGTTTEEPATSDSLPFGEYTDIYCGDSITQYMDYGQELIYRFSTNSDVVFDVCVIFAS